MGLFRKSSKAETISPEVDALACIGVCTIFSDGVLDASEDADLTAHLGHMRIFRALAGETVEEVVRRAHQRALDMGDTAALKESCAALPERLRPTAYMLAAELTLSDEDLDQAEKAFLVDLRKNLGLDDSTAERIFEAVQIRHRT